MNIGDKVKINLPNPPPPYSPIKNDGRTGVLENFINQIYVVNGQLTPTTIWTVLLDATDTQPASTIICVETYLEAI